MAWSLITDQYEPELERLAEPAFVPLLGGEGASWSQHQEATWQRVWQRGCRKYVEDPGLRGLNLALHPFSGRQASVTRRPASRRIGIHSLSTKSSMMTALCSRRGPDEPQWRLCRTTQAGSL